MTPRIIPIVEGDGEHEAVPLFVRKLLNERIGRYDIEVAQAKNAHGKYNLVKQNGLEKFLDHCAGDRLIKNDAIAVLILLDADEDCAKDLALSFSKRARASHI
jgi:hypothetical protein